MQSQLIGLAGGAVLEISDEDLAAWRATPPAATEILALVEAFERFAQPLKTKGTFAKTQVCHACGVEPDHSREQTRACKLTHKLADGRELQLTVRAPTKRCTQCPALSVIPPIVEALRAHLATLQSPRHGGGSPMPPPPGPCPWCQGRSFYVFPDLSLEPWSGSTFYVRSVLCETCGKVEWFAQNVASFITDHGSRGGGVRVSLP